MDAAPSGAAEKDVEPHQGGTTVFEMWPVQTMLNTVMINNNAEAEGDNIEANLHIMLHAAAHAQDEAGFPAPVGFADGAAMEDFGAKMALLIEAEHEHAEAQRMQEEKEDTGMSSGKLSPEIDPANSPKLRHYVSTIKGLYSMLPKKDRDEHTKPFRHTGLNAQPKQPASPTSAAKYRWKRLRLQQLAKLALVSRLPVQKTAVCPHCDLRNTLPPVSAVRPVHHFTDSENSVYPNVCLDIINEETAIDKLWSVMSTMKIDSERMSSHATLEECISAGCAHFTFRVGVAPWIEHFISQRRQQQLSLGKTAVHCAATQLKVQSTQVELRKLRFKIVSLEKLLNTQNPNDERARCLLQMQQIQHTMARLKMERDEVAERTGHTERKLLDTLSKVTMLNEESRRHVATIVDLVEAAQSTGAVISGDRVHRMLVGVLGVVSQAGTLGRRRFRKKKVEGDSIICPQCLLPISSSHYCTSTGERHVNQDDLKKRRQSEASVTLSLPPSGGKDSDAGQGFANPTPPSGPPPGWRKNSRMHRLSSCEDPALREVFRRFSTMDVPTDDDGTSVDGSVAPRSYEASDITESDLEERRSEMNTESSVDTLDAMMPDDAEPTRSHKKRATTLKGRRKTQRKSVMPGNEANANDNKQRLLAPQKSRKTSSRKVSQMRGRTSSSKQLSSEMRSNDKEGTGFLPPISSKAYTAGATDTVASSSLLSPQAAAINRSVESLSLPAISNTQSPSTMPLVSPSSGSGFGGKSALIHAGNPAAATSNPTARSAERPHQEDPHEESTLEDTFEVLQRQMGEFIAAAAGGGAKNMKRMRELPVKLLAPSLASDTHGALSSGTLQQLHDTQEQFYEWYSLMLPQLGAGNKNLDASNVGGSSHLNQKALEQSVLQLKKELRNYKYAFAKRPKGRSHQGANLDDNSFSILALKISEFEKRNQGLKMRLKNVVDQRRVVQKRIATLQQQLDE